MFGGLQKTSLIDYPGKTACVLFVAGCNFECPYCHNPELVRKSAGNNLSETEVFAFLESRHGFLDAVVISGGEPTLRPDLMTLCEKIKQMGFALKLDTNGSRPDVLKRLIAYSLLDYVAMDVKTDGRRYGRLTREFGAAVKLAASAFTILSSGIAHEFRTTCIKPFVDDRAIAGITEMIQGARRYVLQRFVKHKVLDPAFFQESDRQVTEDDLKRWQSLAEERVEQCIIR